MSETIDPVASDGGRRRRKRVEGTEPGVERGAGCEEQPTPPLKSRKIAAASTESEAEEEQHTSSAPLAQAAELPEPADVWIVCENVSHWWTTTMTPPPATKEDERKEEKKLPPGAKDASKESPMRVWVLDKARHLDYQCPLGALLERLIHNSLDWRTPLGSRAVEKPQSCGCAPGRGRFLPSTPCPTAQRLARPYSPACALWLVRCRSNTSSREWKPRHRTAWLDSTWCSAPFCRTPPSKAGSTTVSRA